MLNLLATLTVALTMAPSQADGVSLRWKLKDGDTFYGKSENKMTQTINVMGMDMVQKQDQTVITRYKVLKAAESGYTVEQTILQSITDADFGAAAAQLPNFTELDKKMKGLKFTMTLNKDLKVTKVEGMKELLEKFNDEEEIAKTMLKSLLSEETMKRGAEETFRAGPDKPVKKGDTWDSSATLPFGPLGDMNLKSKYTYAGPKSDLEQIDYTATATFSAPKEDAMFGPAKVKKLDLKSDKYTGTMLFDAKLGRIKETKTEMSMGGTMTMGIGELEIEMTLKTKMSMKVEILEKNPVVD